MEESRYARREKGKPVVVTRPIQKLILVESSNNNCEGMDDIQGEKKGMNGDVWEVREENENPRGNRN